MFMYPHLLTMVVFLFPALSAQPFPCTPCSCYHHAPHILHLTCNNVDISNLDWKNLPHLETSAVFTNLTNFGFHQFPAIWRNLTTSLTVSDVVIEDFDLSGFFVIQKLHIANAVILNQNDIITVQKSLRELTITNTDLSIFNLNTDNIIESLDLSKNQLENIPVSSQLSKLILRDNKIRTLSTTACEPIKGLTLLDLSGNQLTDLPENAFNCIIATPSASAPMLTVNLSRNAIRTIHPRAFVNTGIEKLDLSNNKLRNIDSATLDWQKMAYLNLQHNPWSCQCPNQWMLDELIPFMYKFSPGLLYHLRCGSPKGKLDRALVYWYNHTDQVFCQSNDAYAEFFFGDVDGWSVQAIAVMILGCVIVCLLLSIIVVLFCCLRERILRKAKNCGRRRSTAHYSPIGSEIKR